MAFLHSIPCIITSIMSHFQHSQKDHKNVATYLDTATARPTALNVQELYFFFPLSPQSWIVERLFFKLKDILHNCVITSPMCQFKQLRMKRCPLFPFLILSFPYIFSSPVACYTSCTLLETSGNSKVLLQSLHIPLPLQILHNFSNIMNLLKCLIDI